MDMQELARRTIAVQHARIETLECALRRIIEADDRFRKSLPDDWDGDPVTDACNAARHLLA
ncbi:MAG: hypothetical protein AB7F39_06510 [Variibacter sp.]